MNAKHRLENGDDTAIGAFLVHAENDADSERAGLLRAVTRYRAAWRELAEALDDCERRELWRRWSYASFEVYCMEELRLSKQVITRYRQALAFLREQGPAAGPAAPLQNVELARKAAAAAEGGEIPHEQAKDLIDRALAGEQGARELSAELEAARPGGFKPRLFAEDTDRPDPEVLAKARKLMARFEVVSGPLRERMPTHVLDAMAIITSYLENPEELEEVPPGTLRGPTANEDAAKAPVNGELTIIAVDPPARHKGPWSVNPHGAADPVFARRDTEGNWVDMDGQTVGRVESEVSEVNATVCSIEPDESEEPAGGAHIELPVDLDERLKPKLLAQGFAGNLAYAALVIRYAIKMPRRLAYMAEDHRAAAVELVRIGLLHEREAMVYISHACRELLAELYESGGES